VIENYTEDDILNNEEWEEIYGAKLKDNNNTYHTVDMILKSVDTGKIIIIAILNQNIINKLDKLRELQNSSNNVKHPEKMALSSEKVTYEMDKLRELQNISNNVKHYAKIALYSGKLNKEVQEYASKYDIYLFKKLVITHNGIEKIISLKKYNNIKSGTYPKNNNRTPVPRRQRITIVKEILNLMMEGNVNITKIIYKCNLNYEYAISLIEKLINEGYVEAIEYNAVILYRITDNGIKYLKSLNFIE